MMFISFLAQSNLKENVGRLFARDRGFSIGKIEKESQSLFNSDAWITFFIIIVITTVILLAFLFGKKILFFILIKKDREKFLSLCEEKNLTVNQIKILETLAKKYKVFPSLLLSSQRDLINLSLKEGKALLARYSSSHAVYVDFNANIQHIRSVFYHKKPSYGEVIHTTKDIRTGALLILYHKNKEKPSPVKTSVLHIDNHQIAVKITENWDSAFYLINKKNISAFYNHQGDANYDFDTEILAHREVVSKNEKSIICILSHAAQIRRKQRRKFIRVRVSSPLVINHAMIGQQFVPVVIQGTLIDISEGGCCFKLKEPVQVDNVINISFFLKNQEIENVVCQILRLTALKDSQFLCHVSFLELNDENRSNIKNFVLNNINRRI